MTINELKDAVGGKLLCGDPNASYEGISLNSAKTEAGNLFVPVVGERVDAHRFLANAFQNGAAVSFSAAHGTKEALFSDVRLADVLAANQAAAVIAVDDTVVALQRLGRYVREHSARLPLVGVTGSVGKTTTREMIACALASQKRVFATKGNANSQVGLPITMTQIPAEAEVGVIELGMSQFGEMTRISAVAEPDLAVITNIGISHINQLKTQENILIEKLHILDGMRGSHCTLLVNGDDPHLAGLTEEQIHGYGIAEGRPVRILRFGTEAGADLRAEEISYEDGCARFTAAGIPCRLSVRGAHMVLNALAALLTAKELGLDLDAAAEALSSFGGVSGRGETYVSGGVTVIDDSYNAAPASMQAGLSVLDAMEKQDGRKIAVLADMLELGEEERSYHRAVGNYLAEQTHTIDLVLLYGPLANALAEGIREKGGEARMQVLHFEEKEALSAWLKAHRAAGDMMLFKGSNGMGLSGIVRELFPREGGTN